VLERQQALTRSIAEAAGKPWTAAAVEAERAADTLLSAAIACRQLGGDVVPLPARRSGPESWASRWRSRRAWRRITPSTSRPAPAPGAAPGSTASDLCGWCAR